MTDDPTAWQALEPGDCLNRWQLSAEMAERFGGVPRPMPDTIDYRFVNGWVDTGDLPCRQAWREALAEAIERSGTTYGACAGDPPRPCACDTLYLGGEDERVDLSSFRFEPTLVTRWARVPLRLASDARVMFEIETAGALDLWIDGAHRLAFAPCARNHPERTTLALPLAAGDHALLVRFADLHERDTLFGFRLRLIGGMGVSVGLDLPVDERRLADAIETLAGLRTERLLQTGGAVRVVTDAPPPDPIEVSLTVSGAWSGSSTMRVPGDASPDSPAVRFSLDEAHPSATLFDVPAAHAGCLLLHFAAQVGEARVEHTLGTTLLPPPLTLSTDQTLDERKRIALEASARNCADGPTRALALLARDTGAAGTRADIATLLHASLDQVRRRHDCADFQLMPLLWIRYRYRDELAGTERDALDDTLLGFRYWLDEPGDDVMWFWSENHVLCFQVTRLLVGQLFPERVFANSGLSGREQFARARDGLGRWFDAIEAHGLGEWNSAAYYPIDLIGLLTLSEFGTDATLVERSDALIDRIFAITALHTLGGVPSGSEGRSYEKELLSGPANELGSLAAVAFGGPFHPGHDRATVLFALSSRAPPPGCARIATPARGEAVERRYTQGLDGLGRLSLWKSRHAQLSAVLNQAPGTPGHQQHVLDVRLHGHPMARAWINHPGELKVWGDGRPSYWAGNGVLPRVATFGRVALLLFDLGDEPGTPGFTHAFCPREALEACHHERLPSGADWLFLKSGDGYAGFGAPAGCAPLARGLFQGSEWRQYGPRHGWLIALGGVDLDTDFKTFRARCRAMQPIHENEGRGRMRCRDTLGVTVGEHLELAFDGDARVDGEAVQPTAWRPFDLTMIDETR